MSELIYSKGYGGGWNRFFCFGAHLWDCYVIYKKNGLIIEKNRCIDCGRIEIQILVEHNIY